MATAPQTTDDMLYAGTVADLDSFIKACAFPPAAFLLAECQPPHVIEGQEERRDLLYFAPWSTLEGHFKPARYTSGRIFGSTFELRWSQDQQAGTTRVVYLGEARSLPDLKPSRDLEKLRKEVAQLEKRLASRSFYLFGEFLTQSRQEELRLEPLGEETGQVYYAEVRIPRLLLYPNLQADSPAGVPQRSEARQRVQLVVCEYLDKGTGEVQLFRFQDLKVAQEEKDKL